MPVAVTRSTPPVTNFWSGGSQRETLGPCLAQQHSAARWSATRTTRLRNWNPKWRRERPCYRDTTTRNHPTSRTRQRTAHPRTRQIAANPASPKRRKPNPPRPKNQNRKRQPPAQKNPQPQRPKKHPHHQLTPHLRNSNLLQRCPPLAQRQRTALPAKPSSSRHSCPRPQRYRSLSGAGYPRESGWKVSTLIRGVVVA